MANKYILVPHDIYQAISNTNTGDINLDFISRALENAKKERENASAKNIHYNQELRRYLHLRNERENKPIKVELAGGPKIIASKDAAIAIRDDGLTRDSRGDTDDFIWDDDLFAESNPQQQYIPSPNSSKYYSPSPSPKLEKFQPKYEMEDEPAIEDEDFILAASAPLLDEKPTNPKKKYRARPKERIFQRGQKRQLAEEEPEHGMKIPLDDLFYQAIQRRAAIQGRKNRKTQKIEPIQRISNHTPMLPLPEPEQIKELPEPPMRQSLTAPPQRLALPAPIIPRKIIKRKAIDDYSNSSKTSLIDDEYRGAQQRAILDARRKRRAINFRKTLRMPSSSSQMVLASHQPVEGPIIEEPPSDEELIPLNTPSRFKPVLWDAPSRPLIRELKEKRLTKRRPVTMKFKPNILPKGKKWAHRKPTIFEVEGKKWAIRHPSKRPIKTPQYLDIYQRK